MRKVTVSLANLSKTLLAIGYVGEQEHTQVEVDCSTIYKDYPNAVASLAVRNAKGEIYPAAVTKDENTVSWIVKNSDLVYRGEGEIQLTFTNDNEIIKTVIGRVLVKRSLMVDSEAPSPIQSFIDEAGAALGQVYIALEDVTTAITNAETATENANTAATKIDDMTVEAVSVSPTAGAAATISEVDGHKHIEFEIPQGEQGIPGSEYTVLIQDEQPDEETNKLWIPMEDANTQLLPSYQEHLDLSERVQEIHDLVSLEIRGVHLLKDFGLLSETEEAVLNSLVDWTVDESLRYSQRFWQETWRYTDNFWTYLVATPTGFKLRETLKPMYGQIPINPYVDYDGVESIVDDHKVYTFKRANGTVLGTLTMDGDYVSSVLGDVLLDAFCAGDHDLNQTLWLLGDRTNQLEQKVSNLQARILYVAEQAGVTIPSSWSNS